MFSYLRSILTVMGVAVYASMIGGAGSARAEIGPETEPETEPESDPRESSGGEGDPEATPEATDAQEASEEGLDEGAEAEQEVAADSETEETAGEDVAADAEAGGTPKQDSVSDTGERVARDGEARSVASGDAGPRSEPGREKVSATGGDQISSASDRKSGSILGAQDSGVTVREGSYKLAANSAPGVVAANRFNPADHNTPGHLSQFGNARANERDFEPLETRFEEPADLQAVEADVENDGDRISTPTRGNDMSDGGQSHPPSDDGNDMSDDGHSHPPMDDGNDMSDGGHSHPPSDDGNDMSDDGQSYPPMDDGNDMSDDGHSHPPSDDGNDMSDDGHSHPPMDDGNDMSDGGHSHPPSDDGNDMSDGGQSHPPMDDGNDMSDDGHSHPPSDDGNDMSDDGHSHPPMDDGNDMSDGGHSHPPSDDGNDMSDDGQSHPPSDDGNDMSDGGHSHPPSDDGNDMSDGGQSHPPMDDGNDMSDGGHSHPPSDDGNDMSDGGQSHPPSDDGNDMSDGGHSHPPSDDGNDMSDGGHSHPPSDDGHAHSHYLPPPGVGASASEIQTYLDALFSQAEMHVHDAGDSKAGEHDAAMNLVERAESTHVAIADGAWEDASIWAGGTVPGENARVLIPEGVSVEFGHVSNTELFTIRVDGELSFDTENDSQIIFDTMVVSPTGRLEIGTSDTPVSEAANVNLVIANNGPIDTDWDPMLLSRGVISHGETSIHGAKKDSHEKVTDDPMAGDTSVTFAELPEGWEVGDTIVIAATQYEGYKWDPEIAAIRFFGNEDEERVITSIDGNTVHFETPLVFDHDAPRADLKTSVANYTRNVTIGTEDPASAEIYERGHVMFMHSDEVDVRYAAFVELGRTDKTEDSANVTTFDTVDFDTNVQGRYSVHLHRTGTSDIDDPAIVVGNAVYGSPGWGFVHHDSNALLENNASFGTVGAGYVAETGNETGAWNDNIAIFAQGSSRQGPKQATNIFNGEFDTARNGEGFWFQGRLVESTDNIAASVNHGFVYFHRDGSVEHMIDIPDENFVYGDALLRDEVRADDTPILEFSGNEVFAVTRGLTVIKGNPSQGHDVWSVLEDFTGWGLQEGVHIEYSSHYILRDFDLIGAEIDGPYQPEFGLRTGSNMSEIIFHNNTVEGFETGIQLDRKIVGQPAQQWDETDHNYILLDNTIVGADSLYGDQYDPTFDTVYTGPLAVTMAAPQLIFDAPIRYNGDWQAEGGAKAVILGTKIDNLGEVSFPNGMDHIEIKRAEVAERMETDGYWSTSDGELYILVDIYTTDRLTGNVFYETHPIFLDNVTPGTSTYLNAIYNGQQDITEIGGARYAGDVLLDVAIPAVPDFEQITLEEVDQLIAESLASDVPQPQGHTMMPSMTDTMDDIMLNVTVPDDNGNVLGMMA